MKTKQKETKNRSAEGAGDETQAAIDAMACELYRVKQANRQKAEELAKLEPTVDVDEAPFLAGVPFAFDTETADGRIRIRGKLRLKNSRTWDLADVVQEKIA